ncbi:receptor-type tyrosine-protein phosphatase alpha-like [Mercenaria mercenaria]|uniref:receptor-type tyrosine-protein phosphatase alpha-like n=1 Tax=Mercenaria mercenaria TaxID=6596 RepID=UPI00234FA979|nr:receptor-type tyrosine-protein phosphatase alpha-like [Mercenaria mercenaria]
MIWEKNVYTIAMVTNLVEEKKTKCLQYWPTVESSTRYGDFTVRTESEAIFAEFTIRNLKVDFEEGKPSRTITQFHFTAWPDHGVPRSTSSLLQFWRKVRNNDANKAHTWLVHCSAGVGRTGTFIATDILYDQGKEKGSVDIHKCVRNLRDQRVNMVQTKDQYLFLHGLMIEALILPSEPVPLEHFHQVLNDLKDVDNAARKTKLLLQYETLKEDMTYRFTKDDTEEKYSAAMLEENRNKNRNNSILPSNEFRPFLATAIAGCTNYINAVYIPSYCDIHGYIITQNPLENTAIDCCRLVYEQEAKVIVTFPSKVKEKDGTYLPEDGTVNLGPFTVTKMSEEDKHFYKKKTFVMAYNSEERELTQLMFSYWPVNRIIPSDPLKMLNFMQEVEFHRRIADNKPVLVQCRDGSEKSGLFVVLMNILERARLDNEVSIPQVIRQLRIRRQQIIPNFEQFKFCHDVLLCHVDSNAVYANM